MSFDSSAARDTRMQEGTQEPRGEWLQERDDAMDERVNRALRLWLEGMERAIEEASGRRRR